MRIKKNATPPPDFDILQVSKPQEEYFGVVKVVVPNAILEGLSFGVSEELEIGSVVWVSLRGRKKPLLGLVAEVEKNNDSRFKLKPAIRHGSGYAFSRRYVETLLWCAGYYMCSAGEVLTAMWNKDVEGYLDGVFKGRLGGDAEPSPLGRGAGGTPPLTEEQSSALAVLRDLLNGEGFRAALFHGVTGSGKTRVYLELVKKALELEVPSLILIPEINLTPQTRSRFEEFLGVKVPILHSSLGAKEKRETYLSLLNGEAKILMGTRSAILAPFEPKLIILDEEHDSSYKQQDPAPRYNTRDTAFHIAHKYGALVVLGSATPSMESWYNAKNGNLTYISMNSRPTGFPLPKVAVADMKKCLQDRDLMLSPMLRDALAQTLSKGEQAIILLNRRGYNSAVICGECGENLECVHCKVALVYHRQFGKLMCHYCGTMYKVGFCKCGSKNFIFAKGGIEKAEEEIKEWLPAAKVLRLDSDTTGTIGATEKLLQRFRAQECNVLLGTQMVAKGHDFPNVSLVGVIGADIGSGIPDFRAGERSFQLLTQVAGRAGRLLENSSVIVQTFCPENPVIQFAVKHDFVGFAKWELEEREEAFYPPFGKIAQIKMQAQNEKKLVEGAEKLKEVLMRGVAGGVIDAGLGVGVLNAEGRQTVQILGPVEPFVSKVQNQFRRHIMVKAVSASVLKNAIKTALSNVEFAPFAKGMEIRIDREA